MKYLQFHDNGMTQGVTIGKFGGRFYLHVYYMPHRPVPRGSFKWHICLHLAYPRWIWVRSIGGTPFPDAQPPAQGGA